ncbi:MAG: KOW domain-containing RNA-binding protein [Clostridiaceae bacterium]
MEELLGRAVMSVKGRDQGRKYVVVKIIDKYFILVADGDKKTWSEPKRKNRNHVVLMPEVSERLTLENFSTNADDRISEFLKCHIKEE